MPSSDMTLTANFREVAVCCADYPDCYCEMGVIGLILNVLRVIIGFLSTIFPWFNWPEI